MIFFSRFRALTGGLLLLIGLSATGCNSGKTSEKQSADEPKHGMRPVLPPSPTAGTSSKAAPAATPAPAADDAAAPKMEETSVRIGAWLTQAKEMDFAVKPESLLAQFIREFHDGTVVDKVMVAPAQDGPRGKPTFYLVGMGQNNGKFRAMALPLEQSNDDGGLYLKPTAARHIAEGSNCVLCYFRFSRGKVTGVDCSEESTGSVERRCEYRTEPGNGFFTKK